MILEGCDNATKSRVIDLLIFLAMSEDSPGKNEIRVPDHQLSYALRDLAKAIRKTYDR